MRSALAFLLVVSCPSIVHAAEDDPNDDARPIRYASVELNPLATGVGRYGGQAQVAVMGPLTFVGGLSRIDASDLEGWSVEVGSRLFFGLAPRRADGERIAHVFLSASYIADDLRAGGRDGERRGFAFDAGVHARLGYGFYALAGAGVAVRTTDLDITDRFEQLGTTPRLVLALGWGL